MGKGRAEIGDEIPFANGDKRVNLLLVSKPNWDVKEEWKGDFIPSKQMTGAILNSFLSSKRNRTI